jgi:hypothetical protein
MARHLPHHHRRDLRQPGSDLKIDSPPMTYSLRTAPTQVAISLALTTTLAILWLISHRYHGLDQDARIYAAQALANINPALQNDLYLQNTSQDHYTFFSPFYAEVIRLVGLKDAARFLTILFMAWFLAAAWFLASSLVDRDEAWLAVGTLILTVGAYGSYRVFHFSEDYLTARLPAEALIATAIAVHFRGRSFLAPLIAVGALFVHPLMALPGLLLLIFLAVAPRAGVALALTGIASVSAITLAVVTIRRFQELLPLVDTAWLQIVRERSQFLFLQLWSLRDWGVNVRPFASLALSVIVLPDARVRRLCGAAALVGASGLAVAGLTSLLGPVALLMQGQAWRWVWVTVYVSAILMIPTAIRLWRDEKCGPLCAILLIISWTISAFDAPLLAVVALAVFLLRARIPDGAAKYSRWATVAVSLAILYWVVTNVAMTAASPLGASAQTPFLQRDGSITTLRLPLVAILLIAWQGLRIWKSVWVPTAVAASLLTACALLPLSYNKIEAVGSASEISEFADWRRVIPPTSNVYVASGHDAATFAWFTLSRPSYLSLDQSAGVIFSRATALEVQRRSQVLLPLMDEDWKLLSNSRAARSAGGKPPRWTPLTAQNLIVMCSDPQLGFLVARENVGFEPIPHRHAGSWNNWNLYDCAHVRSVVPTREVALAPVTLPAA